MDDWQLNDKSERKVKESNAFDCGESTLGHLGYGAKECGTRQIAFTFYSSKLSKKSAERSSRTAKTSRVKRKEKSKIKVSRLVMNQKSACNRNGSEREIRESIEDVIRKSAVEWINSSSQAKVRKTTERKRR